MSEFQVPTVPVAVEIRCADGRSFAGHVFLPTLSSTHEGAMQPEEWANRGPTFFPFTPLGTDARTVLNKREVIALTIPDLASPAPDPPGDGPAHRVVIEAEGARYEGTLVVDMPVTHRRVVDFLNRPDPFVAIRDGFRQHLIQKARITRVVEFLEG